MTILEEFYIKWRGDTSDLKKGSKEAKETTDKLNQSLKVTRDYSEALAAPFLNLARSFTALIASAISIGTFVGGIRHAIDYGVELSNTARLLNVNTEELDAWGNAVQKAGGTAQGFQSSLQGLAQHLGGSTQLAIKVLPQLSNVFQNLGRVRALQYGKMLGLDEPTILLLQRGRREVDQVLKRQKELGLVSKENQEIFLQYRNATLESEQAFRSFNNMLALEFLPTWTKAAGSITNFFIYLREHKDLVRGALLGIAAAATLIAIPFIAANAAVILLTASIAALVSGFAILFEDIKYFIEGKPSLLGDLNPSGGFNLKRALTGRGLDLGTEQFVKFLNPKASNIFGNNSDSNSITTGPITINTQATDAAGIASSLSETLMDKLTWHSNNYFADGVQY